MKRGACVTLLCLLLLACLGDVARPAAAARSEKPRRKVAVKVVISPPPDASAGTIQARSVYQPAAHVSVVVAPLDQYAPEFAVALPIKRFLSAIPVRGVKAQVAGLTPEGKQARYYVNLRKAAAANKGRGLQLTLDKADGGYQDEGWPRLKLPAAAVTLQDSTVTFTAADVSCRSLSSKGLDVCSPPFTFPANTSKLDTFYSASGSGFSLSDLARGTLTIASGPNLPFQRAGRHRVGFLARGQAAYRLKTRLSTKRHHALLAGLYSGGKPFTALLRLKTLAEAPNGITITFDLVNSTVPAGSAAGAQPAGAAALEASDNTTVSVATLSSACAGCLDVPSIGKGYNSYTGSAGYAVGTVGNDPGLLAGQIYDATEMTAYTSVSSLSKCSGQYTGTTYSSTYELMQSLTLGSGISASGKTYTFGANLGYGSSSTAINQQSSSAWSYMTTCVVMTASTTSGTCGMSLDDGVLGQLQNLVNLMNQANAEALYSSASNSTWHSFYIQVSQSLLPIFGDMVVLSGQFGGAIQTVYQGTTSAISGAQSQGVDFGAQASAMALSGSLNVQLNQTATSTLESNSVSTQWTVTPANVTVPYNSENLQVDVQGWATNLQNVDLAMLVPITSTVYSYLTDVISSCASNTTAVGASLQEYNITQADAQQLASLIANFYNNCGNTTYGITMSCTDVNSYCTQGYYATCTDPSSCPSPGCTPCTGAGMCDPSSTNYCTGPSNCYCNCGYGGSTGTCSNVCWYGTCSVTTDATQVSSDNNQPVTFWENCNNGGSSSTATVGAYTNSAVFPCNDCVSALSIPNNNIAVELWKDSNYANSNYCFTYDASPEGQGQWTCINDVFKDEASSAKIYGVSTSSCSPLYPYPDANCNSCKCSDGKGNVNAGNSCPTSMQPPQAPYLQQCGDQASCSVNNQWQLTCSNCAGTTLSLNICGVSGGCTALNNINLCYKNGGSTPYLYCGPCPASS